MAPSPTSSPDHSDSSSGDVPLGPRPPDDGQETVAAAKLRAKLRSKMFGVASGELAIGRYKVIERLGSGGMGEVYSALDERLDRKVAIKVLHADVGTDDPARRRLVREARVLARLNHPHVVQIFEVGEDGGRVYLVMELIEGPTLEEWLQTERAWPEILEKFVEAAQGLAAAHEVGVVHRDVKPANLLLGPDGRLRVVDFGLARGKPQPLGEDASGTSITQPGTVMGTPGYMSPEHVGEGPVDARSDQFSLCVALFEALFGYRPHRGEGLPALMRAIAKGKRQPPPRLTAIPRSIVTALDRGLSTDPQHRFASLDELADALRRPRRRAVWPFALAISLAMLAIVGVVMTLSRCREGEGCEVEQASTVAQPSEPHESSADWTHALEALDPSPSSSTDLVVLTRTREALLDGRFEDARSLASEALEVATAQRDDAAMAVAAVARVQVAAEIDPRAAFEHAVRRAEAMLQRAGDAPLAEALLHEATAERARQRGHLEQARTSYRRALDRLDADDYQATYARIELAEKTLDRSADVTELRAAYSAASASTPEIESAAMRLRYAGGLVELGALELAGAEITTAAAVLDQARRPDGHWRASIVLLRAEAALARDQPEQAEALVETAAELRRAGPRSRRWLIWKPHAIAAEVALRLGDPQRAVKRVREAIAALPYEAPHIVALRALLGEALDAAGHTVEAVYELEAAASDSWDFSADPRRVVAADLAAQRLAEGGEHARAIGLLRAVLDDLELRSDAATGRAQLLARLARVYAAQGSDVAARSVVEEVRPLLAQLTPEDSARVRRLLRAWLGSRSSER